MRYSTRLRFQIFSVASLAVLTLSAGALPGTWLGLAQAQDPAAAPAPAAAADEPDAPPQQSALAFYFRALGLCSWR
jgi:hypothetical protein